MKIANLLNILLAFQNQWRNEVPSTSDVQETSWTLNDSAQSFGPARIHRIRQWKKLAGLDEKDDDEQIDFGEDAFKTLGGKLIRRGFHKIRNYPVWNSGLVLHETSNGDVEVDKYVKPNRRLLAKFRRGIGARRFQPRTAASVGACKNFYLVKIMHSGINVFTVKAEVERYIEDLENDDPADGVTFVDQVSLRGQNAMGEPFFEFCLVDTRSNAIVQHWTGIQGSKDGGRDGDMDGGNVQFGKRTFDKNTHSQYLTQLSGSKCRLASPVNKEPNYPIQAYHMNNRQGYIGKFSSPYSFSCSKGPTDGSTTRSYGPLADAFYGAIWTVQMYREWASLKQITPLGRIPLAVHFGRPNNYANAFWDGTGFYFGDGDSSNFYALVSLDVVAHEISHGVTSLYSRLIYSGQSGCLNEAFSDAMGASAIAWKTGTVDWCIGREVMMKPNMCIRDMSLPADYNNYFPNCIGPNLNRNCKEVHSCSAIVNYAFYKLATTPGWTIRMAMRAFAMANRFYWTANQQIPDAGCKVAIAVKSGLITETTDPSAVADAWKASGMDIKTNYCPSVFEQ